MAAPYFVCEISAFKSKMAKYFDMKDMGEASHILGMRIERDRSKKLIWLSQTEYIDKVLQRFNMENSKGSSVPLQSYVKLSKEDCPVSTEEKAEMEKIPYASAVGSLMYAMIATRPDIAFAVGVVSRYMSNPGKKHWDAVKGILRYLKATKNMRICYGSQELSV
ncbi:reverse transcriptase domain-containing protein, partial [Salmonella enterica subsp. enterica serovar Paratyphi A]